MAGGTMKDDVGTRARRSERAPAEDVAALTQKYLLQLLDGFPNPIWRSGTDAKCDYFNKAWLALTGRALEQELGDGWAQGVHPEDLERCLKIYREAFAAQRIFSMDYRLRRADGEFGWIADYGNPYHTLDGKFAGYIGVCFDIAEQRRGEEALRLHDEIVRNMAEGVCMVRAVDETILYANPRFEKLFGYEPGELRGKPVSVVNHINGERDARQVAHSISERLRQDGEATYEVQNVRKNGTAFWCRAHTSTLHHPQHGDVWVAVHEDITERRRSEAALRESESRFRSLFEKSPDAVFVESEDGVVLDANLAACRLQGLEREQLIGKNVLELVPERERAAVAGMFRKWFTGEVTGFDGWTQTGDGQSVPVAITGSCILYEGRPAVLLHIRNISKRRQAEEALRQLTTQLLRSQEEERRRISRELHDATGQKLAAIAMNLSKINECIEVLPPSAQRAVQESQTLIDRCSQEIRTVSYLLHPPLLEDRGLAFALRWYVEGFSQRSGIPVDLEVPQDLRRLPPDVELTLYRVVQEGLTNIHRHSKSLTAAVRLSVDQTRVTLEVQDTGRGIPTSEPGTGTAAMGVGITGMRERVTQLGGDLEIETSAKGTTIRVVLTSDGATS